ncbi:C40 family peptidase [Pseudonocardia sp. H11422]|uniref:C40 family peptidase n=1 Tax=Pseudonocardia sp. H11422 TaxID=2835866 RepID=UPI001BDCEBE4|nr:C40 family peptidase [Pseudonocardia sp. H11422]
MASSRPGRRLLGFLVVVAVGVMLLFAAVIGAMVTEQALTGGGGCVSALAPPAPSGQQNAPGRSVMWSPEQQQNAQVIADVGRRMGAPDRAVWIALATAMQESTLKNLPDGHADSVGLFQQRPSQGWGSPDQLQDPAYAAQQFYSHLLDVQGWETMPLTQAAQTVQRSAFPDAYAKWEQTAADLLSRLGAGVSSLLCEGAELASGVAGAALDFAKAQLGKPYLWGGTGPDKFDCSGLTLRAWQSAGVQLPRTSREQARAGQRIPREQAQPGDLLFWSSNGSVSGVHHVALYLGNNQIREAPQTGVPVRDRQLGGAYDERELLPYAIRPGTAAQAAP